MPSLCTVLHFSALHTCTDMEPFFLTIQFRGQVCIMKGLLYHGWSGAVSIQGGMTRMTHSQGGSRVRQVSGRCCRSTGEYWFGITTRTKCVVCRQHGTAQTSTRCHQGWSVQ